MSFAIIRLGKDSVADIKILDAQHQSPAIPIHFTVRCSQVPQGLAAGDFAFFCFGSDNDKGMPTEWDRGVRAFGTILSKKGGRNYNDQSEVEVEVRVVLPQSVAKKSLLAKAPTAYYWSSDIPVLGIEAFSNQTIQLIKDTEPNQNVAALAYGLSSIYPSFRYDTIKNYPALAALFNYVPPEPIAQDSVAGADSPKAQGEWLTSLSKKFAEETVAARLRVQTDAVNRFIAALLSKQFLIATGLSGSGKTMLAQAFARWLTPKTSASDPFLPGATIEGARKVYSITGADRLGIEVLSETGVKVLLPRAIIEQWADYVEAHGIPETIGAQELRDLIKKSGGEYSDYLQNLETHYKPAAFALIKSRRVPVAEKCYEVVPVGADWTGNENIVGYPNGLDGETYMTRPALELIRHACKHENALVPHFLILDEMNLSHVERYFADVLSAIESEEEIPLYEGSARKANGLAIPQKIRLPRNLFIIGTVNVDETTYMFSPKVLDRANVIEFRMTSSEIADFLAAPHAPNLAALDGKGAEYGKYFVESAADKSLGVPSAVKSVFESEMLLFFNLLREQNTEFGYRTGYEAARFVHFCNLLGGFPDTDISWFEGAMDAVVIQKFLPKLHGSRSKLEGLLWALVWACGADRTDLNGKDFATQLREAGDAQDETTYGPEVVWSRLMAKSAGEPASAARYPLSFDKVMRMWRKLVRDQFVSFAEA